MSDPSHHSGRSQSYCPGELEFYSELEIRFHVTEWHLSKILAQFKSADCRCVSGIMTMMCISSSWYIAKWYPEDEWRNTQWDKWEIEWERVMYIANPETCPKANEGNPVTITDLPKAHAPRSRESIRDRGKQGARRRMVHMGYEADGGRAA